MDRGAVTAELKRVRLDFRDLVDNATSADLRRRTKGTGWTNEQLLFHMLFGYLLVRTLMVLVRVFARLPRGSSRLFAAALDAATRPFHLVNYVGSLGGARMLGHARMERLMDRITTYFEGSLMGESDEGLRRGMHFPVGWDPYFKDYMTIGDVYHYPTQHYDHHRKQLTLPRAGQGAASW